MRRTRNLIRNHNNWMAYLLAKLTGGIKKGFTFRTRSGMNISVPPRMLQTYKECFLDESYHKGFPEAVLQRNQSIVVDVGANVGYFSLYALHHYPDAKVYAYEPMPQNFAQLKIYRAAFPQREFHIFNMAVSGTAGSIQLGYDPADSFTTDASIFQTRDQPGVLEVKTTTLANILEENNLPGIDLLKLDCEGSEYSIIYDAPENVLKKISCLAVETHKGPGLNENLNTMEAYLKGKGYKTNVVGSKVYAW